VTRNIKGMARHPGPSVQDVLAKDTNPPPAVLKDVSYQYLGDEDVSYDRYTSRDFYDQEISKVWSEAWQWACREEHIPGSGDYCVYDIGRRSFIITRDEEGVIRAFYNACLHRGTKLKPSGSQGAANCLRCPFHGWTWALDGNLRNVPCDWDFPKVTENASAYQLPEARVATWNGFVFICLSDKTPSLEEFLSPLTAHFSNWNLEDRYIAIHVEKELGCNWKNAMEAFLEAYHVLETHPQLLEGVSDANIQYDTYSDHVSRFIANLGLASPHLDNPPSEQDLLNKMLVGDRSAVDAITLGEGETARQVMAANLRQSLGEAYGRDLRQFSDSEVIDTIEYHVFPNMVLFPGLSLPMVYRFRPLDDQTERCLFDLVFLRPTPENGEITEPAEPIRLREEDSYGLVEALDSALVEVYDQDTNNLRHQQEGFWASKKPGETLSNYQESLIRHFHLTLDKYMGAP